MKKLVASALSVLLVGVGFAGTSNPAETLKNINETFEKAINEARNSEKPDYQAIINTQKQSAIDAVEGVNPMTINPEEAEAWKGLFGLAGQPENCLIANEIFLSTNPDREKAYGAQVESMYLSAQLNNLESALAKFAVIKPYDAQSASNLISAYSYGISNALMEKDPAANLRCVEILKNKISGIEFDDRMKARSESSLGELSAKSYAAMGDLDKADEVVDKMIESATDPRRASSYKAMKMRFHLVGANPSEIDYGQKYGNFTNLEDLKGKVVLLDFFAHWCGPCKAAFPEMKELYENQKDNGLEIVGVTTFYGSYNNEQNLSQDQEYAKMEGFIDEHQLPWSVVFGPRTNFENFGVSGIPHLVVIDKKGVVRKIEIGYSEQLFSSTKKLVEELLAE